ncbi:MAG: EAL domain-containing protein [Dermatophilaceae bacterium]
MSYLVWMRDRAGWLPAAKKRHGLSLLRLGSAKPLGSHTLPAWTVLAVGCVIAMFARPEQGTIPYHLGWAGFALAFGLGTWSRWQLVASLTWFTLATGTALAHRWWTGEIGWDETTEIPLMLLLALMMVWHVRRRQASLAAATRLATMDGLTGLANRATFNSAVSTALEDESPQRITVLFVDLDDFKGVNDRFGHGVGDDVLHQVATRLRRATRPGDLCARLGGDEFAVLLRDTGVESTATGKDVAERIVKTIATTMQIRGRFVHVRASIGVATVTGETDLEQLIHFADVAMYAAKAKGKGVQVFEPGLLDGDFAQEAFERMLSAAAGNGELVVHYQPVLSLPDGRCTAVEALVRWHHPERGLLYPDAFIEASERIGAIRDIGAFVLRRACADAATWRDAHPRSPLAIHVNVSALQLDDDSFIESVTRCLSEFNLPADQLVLEITESVVVSSALAIDRINTLAEKGVTIAIDDFGTGYSALTTLRSLPAKIVKIDKSFVAGSTENMQDRAVIEAVVKMAAQMGMQTIAEGVERLEQRACLELIGADAVQGYLHLRPTTAEKFGTWFAAHLAGLPQTRRTNDVVLPFKPRHPAAKPERSATVGAVPPTRVTQGKPVRIRR